MAQPSDADELEAAWRALDKPEEASGWRTIRIARESASPILAGRWFPDRREALLLGFPPETVHALREWPHGQGFEVSRADLGSQAGARTWIGLRRSAAGRQDLFAVMARDVVNVLEAASAASDTARLRVLLARIHAWQDFMRGEQPGLLGADAEVGLFGEIEVITDLIGAGVSSKTALEAWRGPQDGLQDFVLGPGAIEVKTTVAAAGFLATIASLEQLDDSIIKPMFVAAVRIVQREQGDTLPERVTRLKALIADDASAVVTLGHLLLHAGYIELPSPQYTRRFSRVSVRLLRVGETFPRITRASIAPAIASARYAIELDLVRAGDVSLPSALSELGVIS